MHHAFVIESEAEGGIATALRWVAEELGLQATGNPDVVVLRYGLFSVEDARKISELAASAPFIGDKKALVIAAGRVYHEAQNALLKVFEEPSPGTHLFLVVPTLGGLLPTLRSRVVELAGMEKSSDGESIPEIAQTFIKSTKEKRAALVKKLSTGRDEDERRTHRDEAIAIVNGIEATTYARCESRTFTPEYAALLEDIAVLRGHLYDRSAPVKMILEHLALVTPKDLV